MPQKIHYAVPQRMATGTDPLTMYLAACNHTGAKTNGTTDWTVVTCVRCQRWLTTRHAHAMDVAHAQWEADRALPDDPTLAVQWIGEAAVQAEQAYEAGDYDTLKACLEAIQHYAMDCGFNPNAAPEVLA